MSAAKRIEKVLVDKFRSKARQSLRDFVAIIHKVSQGSKGERRSIARVTIHTFFFGNFHKFLCERPVSGSQKGRFLCDILSLSRQAKRYTF